MKIASANLQLASSHASLQRHEVSERLSMWVGQRPGQGGARQAAAADEVQLSAAGKAAAQADNAAEASADEASENDPRLALIRSLVEMLTGRRIEVFNTREMQPDGAEVPADLPSTTPPGEAPGAARPAGWGMEYDRHESYTEVEQTTFSASGTVTTADGRSLRFDLQLSMSRAYHEESTTSLRLGDAPQDRPAGPELCRHRRPIDRPALCL